MINFILLSRFAAGRRRHLLLLRHKTHLMFFVPPLRSCLHTTQQYLVLCILSYNNVKIK